MTPTARSLAHLRKLGWICGIVERWNPWAKKRQDLFGFIDFVAIRPGEILAVQVTDSTSHSKHMDKIRGEHRAQLWLSAGGKIVVQSWGKRGERGKRKHWTLREEEYRGEPPQNLLLSQ